MTTKKANGTTFMTASGSQRVLRVAVIGDVLIALSKFMAAAFTGSSAMFAEGVHWMVDLGNEVLLPRGWTKKHASD